MGWQVHVTSRSAFFVCVGGGLESHDRAGGVFPSEPPLQLLKRSNGLKCSLEGAGPAHFSVCEMLSVMKGPMAFQKPLAEGSVKFPHPIQGTALEGYWRSGSTPLPRPQIMGRLQFTKGATQILQYKTSQNRGAFGVGGGFISNLLKCS